MNIKITAFTVSKRLIIYGQAILVRKVNIHAYSMYVLFAVKVPCPLTQHYDSGDSQIIPCLSPIACLFVYLLVGSFVFIMRVT